MALLGPSITVLLGASVGVRRVAALLSAGAANRTDAMAASSAHRPQDGSNRPGPPR